MLNTQDESRVRIAKVDCTENQKTCSANDVTSYPTLKFFKLGSEEEAVKYRNTRDLPSLTQFINDQLGSSIPEEETIDQEANEIPAPLKGLVELTDKTFAELTASGNWLIKFYAPWCKFPVSVNLILSNSTVYKTTNYFRWTLSKACSNMG